MQEYWAIVQLAERMTVNHHVVGSSPTGPAYAPMAELVDAPDLKSVALCVWVRVPLGVLVANWLMRRATQLNTTHVTVW